MFPYLPSLSSLPKVFDQARSEAFLDRWRARKTRANTETSSCMTLLDADEAMQHLITVIAGNSAFLADCLLNDPAILRDYGIDGPDASLEQVFAELSTETRQQETLFMAEMRQRRRRVALCVALADISGAWGLDQVTAALTRFADFAITQALNFALTQAAGRGELELPDPDHPSQGCGYVLIALGKLGADELNYSSDVDLIAIYDPKVVRYLHARGPGEGYVRITRTVVRLLESPTQDGHVLRVDLRLRPDPAAMPMAITYNAALTYYESLGQNWERAAHIKARPVAGDLKMGKTYLKELKPYVWRRYLDFAAIEDIQSIKRQIHAHKGGGTVAVAGHDIKVGRGGIREIEFFAQTQQLIWGGREPEVRTPRTLDAIAALVTLGQVKQSDADQLSANYHFLRRVEHRLQMIADQQTQRLPAQREDLAQLANFLGFADLESFEGEMTQRLKSTQAIYAELFQESGSLSGSDNLVFTGTEIEAGTKETLAKMGYKDPAAVFRRISAWHHGRYRATRSTRSRQRLTELAPVLLQRLATTSEPDKALAGFDDFLSGLPSGVQLFSMLAANPHLMDLLAEVMGNSQPLADHLRRNPRLLEAVLDAEFFAPLPLRKALREDLAAVLADARDYEETLDLVRRWAADRRFQIGVQALRLMTGPENWGPAYTRIADCALKALLPAVMKETLGDRADEEAAFAVIALGKLGSREMTPGSDLDLLFIYDPKAIDDPDPTRFYGRLSQRFINAIAAQTAQGRLYEIDMRLRPSGKAGPLATTLEAFVKYQTSEAWTWEHMALTRARMICGPQALMDQAEDALQQILARQRDPLILQRDVADMRERIWKEHPSKNALDVKYVRGGLLDLDFICQFLQLRHAHTHPDVLAPGTAAGLAALAKAEVLDPGLAQTLIEATRLMSSLQNLQRLTLAKPLEADAIPLPVQSLYAATLGLPDFAALLGMLTDAQQTTLTAYQKILVDGPAAK